MMEITEDQLVGTWLHSHEEDTSTALVYRGPDFPFPPSRGRNGYEFRPDHTGTYIGISARDGRAMQEFNWQLDSAERQIALTFPDGRRQILQIVALEPDRLLIQKPQ
jgi:hypothetical protein